MAEACETNYLLGRTESYSKNWKCSIEILFTLFTAILQASKCHHTVCMGVLRGHSLSMGLNWLHQANHGREKVVYLHGSNRINLTGGYGSVLDMSMHSWVYSKRRHSIKVTWYCSLVKILDQSMFTLQHILMQCKLDYCEKEITATLWDYTTVPLWSCLFVQKFRSSVTPSYGYDGHLK